MAAQSASRPGSDDDIVPLTRRLEQLLSDAEHLGLQQDVLILAAYIQADRHIIYGDKRRAISNSLLQQNLNPEGSLYSVINIYKAYASVNQRRQKTWCRERSLDFQTLQKIKDYVTKSEPRTAPSGKGKPPERHKHNELANMLFRAFPENICVYLGHKSLGYVRLKSNKPVIVDNILSNLSNPSVFILEFSIYPKAEKYAKHFIVVHKSVVTQYIYPDKMERSLCVLLKRMVSLTVLDNVRPDILRHFDHYGNREDTHLSKSLEKITKGLKTIIEPDQDTRQLKIYGAKHLLDEIKECVLKTIKKMLMDKEEYRQLMPFPTEDSNVSLLIGPGLEVKHILMPGDVIDVLVIKNFMKSRSPITVDLVKKVFSEFGEIEFVKEFNDEEKRRFGAYQNEKYTWGKVRFTDPKSVNKAIEGCRDFDFKHPLYAKSIPRNRYKLKDGLVLTLHVCRRPYTGTVEIEYKRTPDTPKTLPNSVDIGEEETYVYPAYGKKQVLDVSYVPKIDDDVLKTTLEEQLKINVVKLTRLRLHPRPATPETYQSFKSLIDQAVTKKCKVAEHSVSVSPIKQEDIHMEAKLTVPYDTEVGGFLSDLGSITYQAWFEEENISIEPNIGMSLFVPREMWHATKGRLKSLSEAIKERYNDPALTLEDTMLQHGDHTIYLASESLERTKVIYKRFQQVLQPEVLSGLEEKDLRYLEGRDGKLYMGINMRRFGVHMALRHSEGALHIFGPSEAAKDALEAMSTLVGKEQEDERSIYQIDIHTFSTIKGTTTEHVCFLRESKDTLSQIYGVYELHFGKSSPVITLKGSPHSYIMVKRTIASLLKKKFGFNKTDYEDVCSACFCCPVAPVYNLSRCAHVYCMNCIKSHISIAADDKKFPIKCIHEACKEPVSWQDAKFIFNCDESTLKDVISASVHLYVARNPNIIRCCPTPDCRSIYACAGETRPFWCRQCGKTWCMHCHQPYHGGMPCIMEDFLADASLDPTVVEWIKENPESRKMCGKCKSGIEKIDGCNNIHCINCMSSVCWLCLKYFDADSSDCYDHLSLVHGGISDDDDLMLF